MRKTLTLGFVLAMLMAVGIGGCFYFLDRSFEQFTSNKSVNLDSALVTTLEWARLSEIPSSAKNLEVQKLGSTFNREFVVSFELSAKEVEEWLQESPWTKEVEPQIINGVRHYIVQPGGGAQYADVKFDEPAEKITITAYWS